MNQRQTNKSVTVINEDFVKKTKKASGTKKIGFISWKSSSLGKALAVALVLAISAVFLVQIANQLIQLNTINQSIVEAEAKVKAAQEKKVALTQQVELLQNPEYVAKLARSEYYLSKKGEIIFSLPEDLASNRSKPEAKGQSSNQ